MKKYRIIEHTADIGIEVRARDLKGLFSRTAAAMFEITSSKKKSVPQAQNPKVKSIRVQQKADSLDELFINWLNELLSLSAAKGLIFEKFNISQLNQHSLKAEVKGYEIKNYEIKSEIKAATYHQLKIEGKDGAYKAQVIFDV